jgi:hypothetical protein
MGSSLQPLPIFLPTRPRGRISSDERFKWYAANWASPSVVDPIEQAIKEGRLRRSDQVALSEWTTIDYFVFPLYREPVHRASVLLLEALESRGCHLYIKYAGRMFFFRKIGDGPLGLKLQSDEVEGWLVASKWRVVITLE